MVGVYVHNNCSVLGIRSDESIDIYSRNRGVTLHGMEKDIQSG